MYVGQRLRHLRESRGLSQVNLARMLEMSPSYLNQLERNVRPLTVSVLLRIGEVLDVTSDYFAAPETGRLAAQVKEVLVECGLPSLLPDAQIHDLVTQYPDVAKLLDDLNNRYRSAIEANVALVAEDGTTGRTGAPRAMPHEEVRDFFYERDNYVDPLDLAAEALDAELDLRLGESREVLRDRLTRGHGVEVVLEDIDGMHRYDPARRVLRLASTLRISQQCFRMASQIALLEHGDTIDALAEEWPFSDPAARSLAKVGLANYFAGALLLPYTRFLNAAEQNGYDVERLCDMFGLGFETVCHRLSTLQRPRRRGIPFSFVRVDRAGNMSKRQAARGFRFSRIGGSCPLWRIYEAFAQPGTILTQVAGLPDGKTYFWIARTVSRHIAGHGRPGKTFTVALGCEIRHAPRLVYSRGLDLADPTLVTPIGMGCKVCDRPACPQRAFPTMGRPLTVDENSSTFVPYPAVPKDI